MNEIEVLATYEGLRSIGPWLNDVLTPLDDEATATLATRIELAVHELATNTVDHSNSPDDTFTLTATVDSASISIVLRSRGDAFDVESIPTPDVDEPQVRGYGMMIVEQLVSRLDYDRNGDHSIWTATFDIRPDAVASREP